MKALYKRKTFVVGTAASIIVTFFIVFLIFDIANKKTEAKNIYPQFILIDETTVDPKVWGHNFPIQYESYLKTVDQERTKYGGSEAMQLIKPDHARIQVAQSRLVEDPRLVTMWNGYAFAVDFREERGHAYMLVDQQNTQRQVVVNQPGACLNCHASVYVPMKKMGGGDLMKGFDLINALPYAEAVKHVAHPISCIDCHTSGTMKLRVTRPAFMEGMANYKATLGLKNYDVNRDASHQEMRTYVCAQCHVEYYFKGKEKRLTFPWHKGLKVDEIYSYYQGTDHKDWSHKITGAPVLKAQHPEFEMYSQGIHARSGVSCTDCHMPYQRVGAAKITNHHVQSPMLNLGKACQTCHRWPEEELRSRVEQIQDRTFEIRGVAMDALVQFIQDIGEAKKTIQDEAKFKEVYELQKRAQFYLDFIEAENSMGFHAPGEALRVLGLSIDYTRKGQNKLKEVEKSVLKK